MNTSNAATRFGFDVIRGPVVNEVLEANRPAVVDVVKSAYLTHRAEQSANPRSHFLLFPTKPSARIIALPAYLGGSHDVAGLKWIGSFPENIQQNVPRASAVLILNDYATGYPYACLEASQISAARTAASAVLGAAHLVGKKRVDRLLVFGAGVLARAMIDFLAAEEWDIGEILLYDKVCGYADSLTAYAVGRGFNAVTTEDGIQALGSADVTIFVTTASEPWVVDPDTFSGGQSVLNVSLRDLSPEVIINAHNIVDDIDHCLNANSSPHLTQQKYGNTDFIDGTLAELITGDITLSDDKPKIFSPFGLGILDLAVGQYVHRIASESGAIESIPDFFAETTRWQ